MKKLNLAQKRASPPKNARVRPCYYSIYVVTAYQYTAFAEEVFS